MISNPSPYADLPYSAVMPITSPSNLFPLLRDLGITPRRGLSQNFLVDGNIARKMADGAQVVRDDRVLEIGPGPGALTEEILSRGAHVVAVEADRAFADALSRLQTGDNRLTVFREDILKFDLEKSFGSELPPGTKGKVVSNLPYHLTSPILALLAPRCDLFSILICMVQDEFARRATSPPGSRTYGSFTVFLSLFSNPRYAHKVSSHCFFPRPKVDSAILSCPLHAPPQIADLAQFERFVRTAFEQRRKMLRRSLSGVAAPAAIEEALIQLGKVPEARPEQLSLEDFLALYKQTFKPHPKG